MNVMNKKRFKRFFISLASVFLLLFTISPIGISAEEDAPIPSLDKGDESEDVKPGKGDSGNSSEAEIPDKEFSWDEIRKGETDSKPKPGNPSKDEFTPPQLEGGDLEFEGGNPNFEEGNPEAEGGNPVLDGGDFEADGGTLGAEGSDSQGSNGLPGMDGMYPGMEGGLPGVGGMYPGMIGGLPGMDGMYPGMIGGLPGMGGMYPGMIGGLPGMGGMYPGMIGGLPGMGGMYPGMIGGLPGMGGMYPGMIGGLPGMGGLGNPFLPFGGYGPGMNHLIGPALGSLGDAYFGKDGSGSLAQDIVNTSSSLSGNFLGLIDNSMANGGGQATTKIFSAGLMLPLQGAVPWVDNKYFSMSIDAASYSFELTSNAFDWYNKFKQSNLLSTFNKGSFFQNIPAMAKLVGSNFLTSMKDVGGNVWNSMKNGSLLKDGWNGFKKLTPINKGFGILSGVGVVTNAAEAYHNFTNGNITDGVGNTIGALGDALTAGSLFSGPAAPAVATAGLILSGISLGIRYRKEIGRAIDSTLSFVGNAYDTVYGAVGDGVNAVTDFATSGIDSATNFVTNGIENMGHNVANSIQNFAANIGNGMQPRIVGQGIEMVGSKVADGAANFAQGVSDTVQNVGDTVSNTVDNVGKAVGNTVKSTGKAIGNGLKSAGSTIKGWFGG